MNRRKESLTVLGVGAIGYGMLEILWRGYTHWSMLLTGGLCFRAIYSLMSKIKTANIIVKSICSSFVILFFEFVSGCVFNKLLKLNVWDYSKRRFNVLGQICPLYYSLWLILSIPLVFLCKTLKNKFICHRLKHFVKKICIFGCKKKESMI